MTDHIPGAIDSNVKGIQLFTCCLSFLNAQVMWGVNNEKRHKLDEGLNLKGFSLTAFLVRLQDNFH